MLAHSTPDEGDELPDIGNSDEELEYLCCKDAPHKKQQELKRLRTQVLGTTTLQCGESLDALAEPPSPKQMVITKLPTRQATVLLPDYSGPKQKYLAAFIHKV